VTEAIVVFWEGFTSFQAVLRKDVEFLYGLNVLRSYNEERMLNNACGLFFPSGKRTIR
jgi:hypothetical protein